MAEEQNKHSVQMTRKGLLVWSGLIFFIMGWMFVLGILVGRGTAPVPAKTHVLEKELNELKTAVQNKEKAEAESKSRQNESPTTELGFYEALKKPPAKESYRINPPAVAIKKPTALPATQPQKSLPVAAPAVPPAARAAPVEKDADDRTPAPVSAPAQGGRFTVQVAAFKDAPSAEQMVSKLRAKAYPGFTLRTEIEGKGVWFRVRVGAFDTRADAEAMLNRLNTDQFKGAVVASQ